jgi:glutamyl-tRNA synthetase
MLRVRFAPSPTGYLHIGSARTFIFNWLYARRHHGTVILRIDDTDVDRNSEESLRSIFAGLEWLELPWDELYRQSERLALHHEMVQAILRNGMAYRDFTPARGEEEEKNYGESTWLFNPGMRELTVEESDRRAASGEPFVIRFRVPREARDKVVFRDAVFGDQAKSTADIEDFALVRSNGMPTYHMASCADDADLRISHVIRGQDHLTNTFKHILIFEALGVKLPEFAHLPLLLAPDGSKLSKRKHGAVVSVSTYRDAGFLPQAFINFLALLGWSPKDDRDYMTLPELIEAFSFDGINKSNAVVNFTDDDPFDPKAVWLNAVHLRALPVETLARLLLPYVHEAGFETDERQMLRIAPLIRERIKTLRDVVSVGDFFFLKKLRPYDASELIPEKQDATRTLEVLRRARQVLETTPFEHDALESALRTTAKEMGLKAGQMFQPIRVAVCGRKTAPPLFGTLEVLGRDVSLERIDEAIRKLQL